MPKGKKFNAAEKHFEKKRLNYEKRIEYLEEQLDIARKQTKRYRDLYNFDERQIQEFDKIVNWLLEYVGLSKEEVKKACEKDIEIRNTFEWLNKWSGMFM